MLSIKTGFYGLALAVGAMFIVGMTSAGPPHIPRDSPTSLIPPWFVFNIFTKLHQMFNYLAFVTQPPDAYIIELSTAYWDSEVAYALTKNKILDSVQKETATGGTVSCETVADKLDLNAFIVCRYMDSGTYLHLLEKDPSTKGFSLTPHGSLLADGFHDFMLFMQEETRDIWRAVTTDLMKIKDTEKIKGKSGFTAAYGDPVWKYLAKNPESEVVFNGAMKSISPSSNGAVLMDWTPPADDATFCDIGGGIGSLAAEILNHYPKMSGIVFDRKEVVKDAAAHMEAMGVADRSIVVGGDFLEELPKELMDCDVFFLRYITHDWDDESNVRILKNIRDIAEKSTKDSKKVVVVQDFILETGALTFFEKGKSLMSVNMIANNLHGACERTPKEYTDMFAAAGYKNVPYIVPIRSINEVMEVEI